MDKIQTIDQLVESLKSTEHKNFPKVLDQVEIPKSEFEEYAFWSEDRYTRNCIARTDRFELMLLCWNSHQTTPIHCHGGQKCWVYQVDQSLTEVRFDYNEDQELVQVEKHEVYPGDMAYMDDSMGFHSLRNKSEKKAMTLHLYMNPIDECRVYNDKLEKFEIKSLEYDTIDGELLKISA